MGFFDRLLYSFIGGISSPHLDHSDSSSINPANGLPMIGGSCGVDIHGNPYGFSSHDSFSSSSILSDSWSSDICGGIDSSSFSGSSGGIDSFGGISGYGSNSWDN